MKQFLLYVLIYSFGQISFGQLSCEYVFSSRAFLSTQTSLEENLIVEFEMIMNDISQSVKLSKLNTNIHRLTVSANEILDHAMDLIIQVNYSNLSNPMKTQQTQRAQVIIEHLQQTFGIGNNAMTIGLKNRLDLEIAELNEKLEAQETRKAIGFGRDELYKDFHAESSEKQALGFRMNRDDFIDTKVNEIVEYAEAPKTHSHRQRPIGFIHPQPNATDGKTVKKAPIGFIHFKPQSEMISREKMDLIIFDINHGTFELRKATL